MKHIHILGICGTFMGSLAIIAKQMGYRVTGADQNIYPPMSTYLEAQGIDIWQGYDVMHFETEPDDIIVGNTMRRTNPCVEFLLTHQIPFMSGPEWLYHNVLQGKWVFCVAGTHGKTTTTSMLTWILEQARLNPGFLIGGIAKNFEVSSRYTDSEYFVIEGDEYDTAFFDKRSKFCHYFPRTVILNNLEFDHADIFDSIDAIKRQFHHLLRTVPEDGLIVANAQDTNIKDTLKMGCWTPVQTFGAGSADWCYRLDTPDGSAFSVSFQGQKPVSVTWGLLGEHNVQNAVAAMAAAHHATISPARAAKALSQFKGVKRRLELRGEIGGVRVYDDFAHHPTAIAATLHSVKQQAHDGKIIAILEPRSNTMKMGAHKEALYQAVKDADIVLIYNPPQLQWNMQEIFNDRAQIFNDVDSLIARAVKCARNQDQIVIMSNGGFDNIHQRILSKLDKEQLKAL